ncbi:MAG: PorV/PorQ family protein [Candidatus Zixiibacteriota bacterium]
MITSPSGRGRSAAGGSGEGVLRTLVLMGLPGFCRRHCVAALVLALATVWPPVSSRAADTGGQPTAMLAWGVGARPVAMGGAFTAIAEGPTGFWWNPAGVAQMRENGFEAAMRRMSFDRQAGYLSFVHPFGKEEAAMGLSWIYAGVGDLYTFDQDGIPGDKISDYSNAFAFSFARRFTPRHSPLAWSVGLNLRYLQHNIANINAYTVGFDVGTQLRYRLRPATRAVTIPPEVRVGLSLQRLNEKYPWTTSEYWTQQGEDTGSDFEEKFPLLVRSGVALVFWQGRALLAFDTDVDEKQGTRWHGGGEVTVQSLFAVRAGMDDGDLTLGAGFQPRLRPGVRLAIDYAFAVQPDDIDAEHLFSLGVRF